MFDEVAAAPAPRDDPVSEGQGQVSADRGRCACRGHGHAEGPRRRKTTLRAELDDPKVKFPLIAAGVLVAALLVRKLFC
ncbi:hypothetical protein L1857_31230 [Amycolatopsis thermalba]|uniref:Uncharacterized protein n=1 Tax=Amycolatopsis thermalba TaxID=944492 RepID=A0ABY4P408_9PSEU|nr:MULTISPECIES: hypothetical protein [Amycolatopsis]UQS26956.1 hypothetical protein L1857_31230 [Amycolatopsis thermalba]